MKITIIGTGYVGLVTGACFADVGNTVLCMDGNAEKIEMLQNGLVPIHEPGLDNLVSNNVGAGRLVFSTSYDDAVEHAEVIFLTVDTPSAADGGADLTQILAVARKLGERMMKSVIVVNKSTAPVGAVDQVRAAIANELAIRNIQINYSVVSNPEFLKEGTAITDFMRPDRIVLGSDDPAATKVMRQLYAPFSRNHEKRIEMDVRSAELTKYAANAMLATRISFMNELANLAEHLGADIEAVRRGMGMDPRIGNHFLYAGTGYGGSCFPKDVKALIKTAADLDQRLHILQATQAVNDKQKGIIFDKLSRYFGGTDKLSQRTIAIWGLTFKPNTGDMRDSPSTVLIRLLFAAGAKVRAYDPIAGEEAARLLSAEHGAQRCAQQLSLVRESMEALTGSDVLVLMTEWKEFQAPDFGAIAEILRYKAIFDGRNIYDPQVVAAAGLHYDGIGRANRNGHL